MKLPALPVQVVLFASGTVLGFALAATVGYYAALVGVFAGAIIVYQVVHHFSTKKQKDGSKENEVSS